MEQNEIPGKYCPTQAPGRDCCIAFLWESLKTGSELGKPGPEAEGWATRARALSGPSPVVLQMGSSLTFATLALWHVPPALCVLCGLG